MKKLILIVLVCLMFVQTVALAAPALPPYSSHPLSESELADFFADEKITGFGLDFFLQVYNALEDPTGTVFGMDFTALESASEAAASPYADWVADFVLTVDKDTYALLLGNYGSYGTLPFPEPVLLEAGKEFRVMEFAGVLGTWTYADVAAWVKSFDCVAVPITDEVKAAWAAAGGDPSVLAAYPSADPNTHINISLNLYQTADGEETGVSSTLGVNGFIYKPQAATPPATGDSAQLTLWAVLLTASVAAMLVMRRRAFGR